MIIYLDTSALVPLLVTEPTSTACRSIWDQADRVIATRLLYVEAAAALNQASRLGRINRDDEVAAHDRLDRYWEDVAVCELDGPLMRSAAEIARRFGLRGYDAVHGAAAAAVDDPELVAVSGDRSLVSAWERLGLATIDPNR